VKLMLVHEHYLHQVANESQFLIQIKTKSIIGVQVYTASHPIDPIERRTKELAKSITIGRDCWIGGCAIICPGVTLGIILFHITNLSLISTQLGDGIVVGAGSVVTKSFPEGFLVIAGNPAKVIRTLEKRDL
jgi:maltose O-acetyltransferase